jgi:predicted nucleotidyltransferase
MPTDSNAAIRQRVSRIATKLRAAFPGLDGICLFGSVARGDARVGSDIDLLLFTDSPDVTPTAALRRLPEPLRRGLAIVCCPAAAFYRRYRRRPDFITHVRAEGVLLYDRDGTIRELLSRPYTAEGFEEGVASCLRQLNLYRDPARYRSNYLFCLAHLYAIGRGVVSLALARHGSPEFNRERAFERLAKSNPSLRRELRSVATLQPFYALVHGRRPARLPFSYRKGAAAMRRAVSAIEKVAHAIEAH